MPSKTLIAYDFDWSLIDEDSDNFLVSKLSSLLGQKMSEFQANMQWTDMMNQLMSELHALGITETQMDSVWAQVPFHESMIKALHIAKEAEADIMIISDANTVAISKVLNHYQINNLFTKIITNPAQWNADGKLVINRRVPKEAPHGCCTYAEGYGNTCCVNMCKGQEITRAIQEGGYDRVIYVGDGANDFCPITKLRRDDIALVRRSRVLSKILENTSSLEQIQANVIFWSEATEVLGMYQSLFQFPCQESESTTNFIASNETSIQLASN